MKIIFLGAPGAGKGTQADRLSVRLGIPTISTGAIIRSAVKDGTKMGLEAKKFIEAGALVPDEVVIGIVKERLAKSDCEKGFILDGFPRTVKQAEMLDRIAKVDGVIVLSVPDDVIVGRMSQRRTCTQCQATYHLTALPPKQEGICDRCGGTLGIRSDDAPEVVKNRLAIYHEKTEPIIAYYRSSGREFVIDGTQDPDKVSSDVLSVVEGLK